MRKTGIEEDRERRKTGRGEKERKTGRGSKTGIEGGRQGEGEEGRERGRKTDREAYVGWRRKWVMGNEKVIYNIITMYSCLANKTLLVLVPLKQLNVH